MRSHSILVVDDEANVRSLYRDALSDAGHDVTVASDGVAALDVLRHGRVPCVVFSDVRMPRMDGFELSRALAADPQLAAIPIVVMTDPARYCRGQAGHGIPRPRRRRGPLPAALGKPRACSALRRRF